MTTIRQVLRIKGNDVWSIHPEASVYDSLLLMADKNVGALLVTDGDDLVGIFSERDYARQVALKGSTSTDSPVREIMTEKVFVIRPEQTIEDVMTLMTEKRIRHLPVIEDEKLIGVISIGDVVKSIIGDQEFMIDQLEGYITGVR